MRHATGLWPRLPRKRKDLRFLFQRRRAVFFAFAGVFVRFAGARFVFARRAALVRVLVLALRAVLVRVFAFDFARTTTFFFFAVFAAPFFAMTMMA